MRKKIGWILILIATLGLVFSLTAKLVEPECCSVYGSTKVGWGTPLVIQKMSYTAMCSCAAGLPPDKHYRIIPADFIVLSLLFGAYGVYFVCVKAKIASVDRSKIQ